MFFHYTIQSYCLGSLLFFYMTCSDVDNPRDIEMGYCVYTYGMQLEPYLHGLGLVLSAFLWSRIKIMPLSLMGLLSSPTELYHKAHWCFASFKWAIIKTKGLPKTYLIICPMKARCQIFYSIEKSWYRKCNNHNLVHGSWNGYVHSYFKSIEGHISTLP